MASDDSRPWAPASGGYDELFETIRHRRMVYAYTDDPVSDEEVEQILDAARWAPSGHNSQPWEFVVVRDRDRRLELSAIMKKQRDWIREIDDRFRPHGRVYLDAAPVAVVVLGDVRCKSYFPDVSTWGVGEWERTNEIYYESIGCCIQNMHLAAKSLGLGTVHLTVRHKYQEEIKELLDVPDHLEAHDVIPIGVPKGDDPGQNMSRYPLESKIHRETYDMESMTTDAEFKALLHDQEKRTRLMHGDSSN